MAVIRQKGVGAVKGKGVKHMVTEDLTVGGGHTRQHTEHVSQNCTPETCMISLTNVTSIYLVKKEKKNMEIVV